MEMGKKEIMQAVRLMMELKRRRIFHSLVVTNLGMQFGYWDTYRKRSIITDANGVGNFLRMLDEHDRQEMAFVKRRQGRGG